MDMKSLPPLTETTFYILISLLEPLHGYGIMKKVTNLSNGRVQLSAGTLYGALNNLVTMGLIELDAEAEHIRRKAYHVTGKGHECILSEMKRLKEMVTHAQSLLSAAGGA